MVDGCMRFGMKAVIMAGGEGRRLRPLTCDVPKPMARLCGRPILEYILDLLLRHGVSEASVTLKYLPESVIEHFEQGEYHTLKLNFVEEDKPLGTAGSVKNAASDFTETFLVISGDAMCDYDLSAALQFHREKGADATMLVAKVEDPREYGLVNMDEQGYVTGFLEKPGWGQAVCNTANTGIYILNPDCLAIIPDQKEYDFAKHLFPQMLKQGKKLLAYCAKGYWCDIGDLDAYLTCQRDMLSGKIICNMPAQIAQGIYVKKGIPQGNFSINPPVYIGEEVDIDAGAIIGPHTVIDDGCCIGKDAKVHSSILLQNAFAGDRASVTGAILCQGASMKRGSTLFEGAAAGSNAIIGKGATVNGGVLIWPGKQIAENAVASTNVKYGTLKRQLFEDNGVYGDMGIELTPEICARLGAAIGSIPNGKRVGIACRGVSDARVIKMAMLAGLISTGSHVWDFGECFESQLSFYTAFCALGLGIYIGGGANSQIQIYGEGGLPLQRFVEREIENRFAKGEFVRARREGYQDSADMRSISTIYQQELQRYSDGNLEGITVQIKSSNSDISDLLEDTLIRMGCLLGNATTYHIARSGVQVSIYHPQIGYVSWDKVLCICCLDEFRKGNDVALPMESPEIFNELAKGLGRNILRYLSNPADYSDAPARKLAVKQPWVRDGLFLTIKLLSIMKTRNQDIPELLREIPDYAVTNRVFTLDLQPSMLAELLSDSAQETQGAEEGIKIRRNNGNLFVNPNRSGAQIRVRAEATDMETAAELCADIKKILQKASLDSNSAK